MIIYCLLVWTYVSKWNSPLYFIWKRRMRMNAVYTSLHWRANLDLHTAQYSITSPPPYKALFMVVKTYRGLAFSHLDPLKYFYMSHTSHLHANIARNIKMLFSNQIQCHSWQFMRIKASVELALGHITNNMQHTRKGKRRQYTLHSDLLYIHFNTKKTEKRVIFLPDKNLYSPKLWLCRD